MEAVLAGGCNKSLSRHVHACACVSQHGLRKLGVTNEIWEGHSGGGESQTSTHGENRCRCWSQPRGNPGAQQSAAIPPKPSLGCSWGHQRDGGTQLTSQINTKRCSCWNQGKESRMLKRQAPSCCTPCSRFIAAFLPAPSHNQSMQTISESRANVQPMHEFRNRRTR